MSRIEEFHGTARFTPIDLMGRGAMGVVYRVHDAETDSELALKTFASPSPEQLYRLKQEFRVLADIVHPNLVEFYELFVDGDVSFFTMELVEGEEFSQYARRDGHPDLERTLAAARQLAEGLIAVHAAGKLHRDLKPSNVMVGRDGRVVLLDFGLATAFGTSGVLHYANAAAGTLAYMAPEALQMEAPAPASDWYAVGVMLYEALAGKLPFSGLDLIDRRNACVVPLVTLCPGLAEPLTSLIHRMLAPDVGDRPHADEIVSHLGGSRIWRAATVPSAGAFVGRARELRQLHDILAQAAEGPPAVASVVGPSGIGKSEMIRRFVAEVEAAGGAVLRGRCQPQEAIPYKAFDGIVDELSRMLAFTPVPPPTQAGALLRLFPVLRRVDAFVDAEVVSDTAEPYELRRRGFAALAEVLGFLARRAPLVLWIDDLHWSDLDSAVLLRDLLQPEARLSFLMVLSYRSEDRAEVLALVQPKDEILTGKAVTIELGPLDADESTRLAQQLCETDDRIGGIIEQAHGNPFLVGELAQAVARGWSGGDLGDVIVERIGGLPASSRLLLELVGVAGARLQRGVLLDATGMGERGRPIVSNLEKRSLLRTTTLAGGVGVEIYHDRIRDALLAALSETETAQRHGRLADALERQPQPDAESLFRHCAGAGRRERAADWALQAADEAGESLAFLRAADLYEQAAGLKSWPEAEARQLGLRRAEALVHGGRGALAAPIFVRLAERAEPQLRQSLKRRAAEQYLVSGHMTPGIATLRGLLTDLGIAFPRSSITAAIAGFTRLLPVVLRRRERERSATVASAAQLATIDACHAAAKGFVMVDPPRGLYFAVRSLVLAERVGEPTRLARALAGVGAALIPAGAPMERWGARLIRRADRIAEPLDDPYLRGFTAITRAQISMSKARWREMLELTDAGAECLRQHCRGVTWDLDIACSAATRALEELGELAEMVQRGEQLLRQAEEAQNLYGKVNGLLLRGLGRLIADDPAGAREMVSRVHALWPLPGFSMQHFYALRLELLCDLYEDQPARAWRLLGEAWPTIRRSGLLQHALLRTDAYLLHARVALALAAADAGMTDECLRAAAADAAQLARQRRPDATGHAAMTAAGIAAVRGDRGAMLARLDEASSHYRAAEMSLCLAGAEWRSAPASAVSASVALTCQGVVAPERYAAAFWPGFGALSPEGAAGPSAA